MSDQERVARKGLPGLRGTDHIGITVPNLDEAVHFFVEVIGCEPFYEIGPLQADDNWMAERLNVHPRAIMRRLKFLRCGAGINLEIFEYQSPDQRHEPPRNSDIGGHHLAFYVDDMAKAAAHLANHGVRMMGEPTLRREGPNAGQTWVYFLTPWGLQCELVSYPDGKGYEKETSARLWHPVHPAD